MKKDTIYHRAGINFRTKDGLFTFKNDFREIGIAMGLSEDQIECLALGYRAEKNSNLDDYFNAVLPFGNFGDIERAIEVALAKKENEYSQDIYDLNNIQDEQKFFSIPNDNDYNFFICSLYLTTQLIFRVCITFGSNNAIYLTSYVCTNAHGFKDYRINNPQEYWHNYHIIWENSNSSISQAGGYVIDFVQTTTDLFYFKWNIGLTETGAVLSSFNLASVDDFNNIKIACEDSISYFFTNIKEFNLEQRYPAILIVTNKERTIENLNGAFLISESELSSSLINNNQNFVQIYLFSELCTFNSDIWEYSDNNFIWHLEEDESIPLQPESFSSFFFGTCIKQCYGKIPVLINLISKKYNYYCPDLYIKQTPTETFFGKIFIQNNIYLAGNFLCLKGGRFIEKK